MRKKASVRRTFYRSFCLLIVLPLVAVAAAGSALLYRKLLADAREMVQMRQEAVSSALTQDVRQASLQLAHFLLSEDSEGLALVDELPASSSRPAAFSRGPSWKPSVSEVTPLPQALTSNNALMPGRRAS